MNLTATQTQKRDLPLSKQADNASGNSLARPLSAESNDSFSLARANSFENLVNEAKFASVGAPEEVFDAGMKKNGSYYPCYSAFAATRSGQDFLARFSGPDNGSSLGCLDGCVGGDMAEHSLQFSTQPPSQLLAEGMTRIYLLRGSKTIPLDKVAASDVAGGNLRFGFYIQMPTGVANDKANGAVVLGHEAFVHAERYADDIRRLEIDIDRKNLNPEQIAQRIRSLREPHGRWGAKDHDNYHRGGMSSAERYYKELEATAQSPAELKQIQQAIAADKAKYE